MIIAIIGASAAGKTTLINQLKKWEYLSRKRVIIKREDNFLILNLLKSIFGNRPFVEYKEQKFFNKQPKSLKSKLFSMIVYVFYPLIIYMEFLGTHILYSTFWKSRILLSDRYIYDYVITFEEMLGISNPVIRLFMRNFPRPDLTFYLKISKETSIRRNKNKIKGKITLDPALHGRLLKSYDSLVNLTRIIPIASDESTVSTLEEVQNYIYSKEKLSNIKSISISGIDGSGKTTICRNLKILCEKLDIPVKVINLYHLPIVYKLLTKFGLKHKKSVNGKISSQKSFLWAFLTFIDSHIQYIFALITNFNGLVIFDRYFYDYLVSFEYRKVPAANLFASYIPRSSRSFVFLIKPDSAFKRNTDGFTGDYFQTLSNLYVKVANEQKLIPIQVDKKNPKKVLREVIQAI